MDILPPKQTVRVSFDLLELTLQQIARCREVARHITCDRAYATTGLRFSRLLKLQQMNAPESIIQNEYGLIAMALFVQKIKQDEIMKEIEEEEEDESNVIADITSEQERREYAERYGEQPYDGV